jgi:hypothetical protein
MLPDGAGAADDAGQPNDRAEQASYSESFAGQEQQDGSAANIQFGR